MMNEIKEIFESLAVRIRSPVFGYAFFAFLIINWQPLFFLLFAETPVTEKFSYFDSNTEKWSLLWWPLIIGVLLGLITPYFRWLLTWLGAMPATKRSLIQVKAQHAVLKEKTLLKRQIENLFSLEEESLIERAKRDEAVESISDEQRREGLQAQIESLRAELAEQLRDRSVIDGGTFGEVEKARLSVGGHKSGSKAVLSVKNIGSRPARNIELRYVESKKGEVPHGLRDSDRLPVTKLMPGADISIPLYMSLESASDFMVRLSWENPDGGREEEDFFIGL